MRWIKLNNYVMTSVVSLILLSVVLLGGAGRRKAAKKTVTSEITCVTKVTASSPSPGIIVVKAEAKHASAWNDQAAWWVVQLYRHDPGAQGGRRKVWEREFDGPTDLIAAKKGVGLALKFPEYKIPIQLATGGYRVTAEIKSDTPLFSADGELVQQTTVHSIDTTGWIDVD